MTKNILFIPGLLCDQRLFAAQIAHLTDKGANCVVADITGFDRTVSLAESVIKRNLSTATNWAVVALSMGGYVAFDLLRLASDKISRLVLMNTSARADTDEQKQVRQGLIELADKGQFNGVTPRLLPRLLHPHNLSNDKLTSLVRTMAESVGKESFIRQQTAIMHRPDNRSLLPTITQPTMIIAGEGDIITPPEILREISGSIKGAKYTQIPNTGHLPPLESPLQINHLLDDFILKS
ncbi:MAG: alpha/beta fold hydrolase [Alphaproteobacteria bacterium]|nr:MAG: alpha/beta fold hydrolase [Alphaproteobacteria bacterium]